MSWSTTMWTVWLIQPKERRCWVRSSNQTQILIALTAGFSQYMWLFSICQCRNMWRSKRKEGLWESVGEWNGMNGGPVYFITSFLRTKTTNMVLPIFKYFPLCSLWMWEGYGCMGTWLAVPHVVCCIVLKGSIIKTAGILSGRTCMFTNSPP